MTTPPAWTPTLEQVGGCIPAKTVNVNLPGEETYLYTFNDDTVPNAERAQSIINDAASSVAQAVTVVQPSSETLAANAAKWRAAADIWLSFPNRDADISSEYAALNARANTELALFIEANNRADTAPDSDPVPYWSFPDPTVYGDRNYL